MLNLKSWFADKSERRSLQNPNVPFGNALEWMFDAFGARRSKAGIVVTPATALETTTVWAAVRMISSTLATLPLHVYQRGDEGKQVIPNHPTYALLHDRPNIEHSSFVWRELMLAHVLIYGNAYAEIERNGRGDPVAIWPILPTHIFPRWINGVKVYEATVSGEPVTLPAENVLHIQGFSLDGAIGIMPINLARNAIGLSKATEDFGSSFFSNGAAPSGILSHPAKLGKDGAANLRASWEGAQAGLSRAQRIAILEEGMTWTPLGVPPEHAQFLQTRKFQVAEIARVFLIPPHLLADLERATFSNIEQQGIQYVTYCIEPWARRIEQEINYKLFPDRSTFAEFNLDGLLRGDTAARAQFYTAMSALGVFSINEIRARENLNPIDGGDARLVPMNMAPLTTITDTEPTQATAGEDPLDGNDAEDMSDE